jgi:hypothetical protein
MIWTQIFKNHYFEIYGKSKQNWTMALSGTFVDILFADKTHKFHLNLNLSSLIMAKIRKWLQT